MMAFIDTSSVNTLSLIKVKALGVKIFIDLVLKGAFKPINSGLERLKLP